MMASSSSSGGRCKYDVFLSFRGVDTRRNFVCHLYKALEQKAIHTFIDSEELKKGNKISELLNAVDESSISIVVLSQNYASSTWCLKELVKILDCMDTKKQMVVPIFYEVDPSDIRKLKKEFGKAFGKHEENPYADHKELETWKTALTRIADLSGWDSRQYKDDDELIEKIVGDILEKWIHIPRSSSLANNLVGMDHHIKRVILRLCCGKNDVGVVGIWGMGGIGKTTIARAVYDNIVHLFEHKCFFSNVKERSAKKDEVQMRGELLSMILNGDVKSVGIFNEGSNVILERLGRKKVLVILDDVETFSQIEALLGDFSSFGVGSRILVTTRDKEALAAAGVYETYEPRCLNHNESLELFMKHAFRTNQPSKEYSDLSNRAIEYAQGLPLALKILGASLYDKSIHQWKELLEKIKTIPQRKIMDVLRTSFEGLDDLEKDIFLDIACFFSEWDIDFVIELLDSCGFFPCSGLRVLADRAVITTEYNELVMHDLLQEMGREIVRLESTKEPGKRSRLWSCEDVNHVLTQNTATDAVECLILDLSKSKVDLCIHTGAFVRMTKLRLLMIYYSFFNIYDYLCYLDDYKYDYIHNYDYDDEDDGDKSCERLCPVDGCKQLWRGDLEYLSQELRFLLWHGCPLKSLPSTFIPTNLVRLDMRGSHIQQLWEGIKPLPNLKVIMLSHCQYLVKIPDLTEAINLEGLFLDGCSSLIEFEFHSCIYALQNLRVLDLKGCKQLKILPSFIHMKSLRILRLSGCSNLEKFPEISVVMTKLRWLYLDGTPIKELSLSINNLTGLRVLNLRNCTELKILPSCIHMKSLRILRLSGCSNLEKFPEISMVMTKLKWLYLDGIPIKKLSSSINNLTGLRVLNLGNCTELKTLPTSIHMSSLRTLKLDGCSNLEMFPEISGIMKKLLELRLDETAIKGLPSSIDLLLGIKKLSMMNCKSLVFLPDSINNLAELTHLDLQGCTELKTLSTSIHMSSLQILNLNGCSNLEKFPEISGFMRELSELHLDETAIKGLPSSIDLLEWLVKISMRNCKSLVSLPDSICNLVDLTHLDLYGCSVLHNLPEKLGDLGSLQVLDVGYSGIKQLPFSILRLRNLKGDGLSCIGCKEMTAPLSAWRSSIEEYCSYYVLLHLDLSDCNLLELSDGIAHLSALKTLKLCRNNLESLPVTMNRLRCLRHLELEDCKRLKSIPELSSSIKYIDAHDCTALETVSTPKTRNFDFRFSNCFRLVQANFRDIVETHSPDQDNHLRPVHFKMWLPGSEVPEWFKLQVTGCSVTFQVPPNSFNNKLLGFDICIVIHFSGAHHDVSNMYGRCYWTSREYDDSHLFKFDLLGHQIRTHTFLESDHLFMGYLPFSEYHWIAEDRLDAFQIVVETGTNSPTEDCFTSSCGVRLIYANHWEGGVDGQTMEDAVQQGKGCQDLERHSFRTSWK